MDKQKNSFFIDLLGGTVGGMMNAFVGHPLDLVKVRLQAENIEKREYKGAIDCLIKTFSKEGIRGLYRGLSSPLTMAGLLNAVAFAANSKTKQLVQWIFGNKDGKFRLWQTVIASQLAAPIYCMVLCPVDVVKIQLQLPSKSERIYKGPIDCIIKILKTKGISGLYSGFTVTMATRIVGFPFYFGGYEVAKNWMKKENQSISELQFWKLMISGGIGGVAFWIVVYPIDIVKTRIQSKAKLLEKISILKTIVDIYKENGLKAFYRGFQPCVIRAFPSYACTFLGYELTLRYFNSIK